MNGADRRHTKVDEANPLLTGICAECEEFDGAPVRIVR